MTLPVQEQGRIEAAIRAVLAQCLAPRPLTLAEACALAGAAEAKAAAMGLAVVFSAVDAAGGLILTHRMEGALPASTDIAVNKAFTAAAFRLPTHELGAMAQPGRPLYGVETTNHGRVILFGGGYPCRRDGAVVGAIGVSGGTVEDDMQIATHALRIFPNETGTEPWGAKSYE